MPLVNEPFVIPLANEQFAIALTNEQFDYKAPTVVQWLGDKKRFILVKLLYILFHNRFPTLFPKDFQLQCLPTVSPMYTNGPTVFDT